MNWISCIATSFLIKWIIFGFGFFVILQCPHHFAVGENAGWKTYLTDNPTEFHDLLLTWENNDKRGHPKEIPEWLSGTYVRNGPAQIRFQSERRVLNSWLEGFAKLHSFKMDGANILYSGKMLESPNYLAR